MPASKQTSLFHVIAAFFLLAIASPSLAVKGINPDGTLDKPTISKAYFEGEFWTVINALEAFRKTGYNKNREDSVYAFKYLSVVYAADPTTRAKAESYMYQLIRMMPTIDLLDLYISDNIQSIFVKVKSDWEKIEGPKTADHTAVASQAKPAPAPAAQPAPPAQPSAAAAQANYPVAPAVPAKEPEKKKKNGLKVWAPLALGGVGIAAGTYLIVSLGSESGSNAKTPRPVEVTMEWPKEGSR